MSRHDDWITSSQIRDAAKEALQFAEGRARAYLEGDRVLSLALTRLLEIIGEAARRVTTAEPEDFHVAG
jgi:uncharacterized protein with HEPN domain